MPPSHKLEMTFNSQLYKCYKKSELMLMRRATASAEFRT